MKRRREPQKTQVISSALTNILAFENGKRGFNFIPHCKTFARKKKESMTIGNKKNGPEQLSAALYKS
jgi:hypothetical protein